MKKNRLWVLLMEQIENRMVVECEWPEAISVEEILKQPGYHEMGTNVFVPENEAYDYALERCISGTEQEQKEFKEMLVEWFYSGNWIKEK